MFSQNDNLKKIMMIIFPIVKLKENKEYITLYLNQNSKNYLSTFNFIAFWVILVYLGIQMNHNII